MKSPDQNLWTQACPEESTRRHAMAHWGDVPLPKTDSPVAVKVFKVKGSILMALCEDTRQRSGQRLRTAAWVDSN